MPLNDLSFDALIELSDVLMDLRRGGEALAAGGLQPVFDLTPGTPMRITVSAVMPTVHLADPGFPYPPRPTRSTEAAPDLTPSGDVGGDTPEPVEPPADGAHPAHPAGGTLSAAPSRSDDDPLADGAADSGGGQAMAAIEPPAAPSPGSASALAAAAISRSAPNWTEADDAILIAAIVAGRASGRAMNEIYREVADKLGRPWRAAELRRARIRDRIEAALAEGSIPSPETPAAATVDPGQGAAAGEGATPPAVLIDGAPMPIPDLHGLDLTLWHFLQDHRPRWPLTIGTDLDLVEALGRGEKLPMISADLGIDASLLKNRFHILTNRILDTRGNPTIDGMQRLIRVLRRIVEAAPSKAA